MLARHNPFVHFIGTKSTSDKLKSKNSSPTILHTRIPRRFSWGRLHRVLFAGSSDSESESGGPWFPPSCSLTSPSPSSGNTPWLGLATRRSSESRPWAISRGEVLTSRAWIDEEYVVNLFVSATHSSSLRAQPWFFPEQHLYRRPCRTSCRFPKMTWSKCTVVQILRRTKTYAYLLTS